MLPWPRSRVSDLIEQIEAGADPTPEELRRVQQLQALDIAKAGEDYLKSAVTDMEAADAVLKG